MGDVTTSGSPGFVLPTGTVTFLMTDIEGSTRAWEDAPDALSLAIPRHYAILDEAIAARGGVRPVEQGEGDSVVGAFSRPSDAVAAALVAQRTLAAEPWPGHQELKVRMALHTGEAQLRDSGNYFGTTVIRCARIRALAHGGQVLVSQATAALVADVLPVDASLADLGMHRLKDLGRAERVWQLVHPDLDREFPSLRSLDAYRHNLPLQLSPLIGRGREIEAVTDLLSGERLVTLTGSGGVGKTRLALAVAAELVDEHRRGVWFVELAGSSGAGSAARATLKALDVPEAPAISPVEQVAIELGDADRSLVVLDNCEHMLDDSAQFVATLLGTNPAVSVLATSREQLSVAGEVAWRVPSLAAPRGDEVVAIEALSQYDSVNLFVDRARRARPSFTVTEANAPAIAQVCYRLDGIPLAIELAAARCRHLSADQIAVELDDRFHLLTGGSRSVMPRQQTLAASVEWSFDLLDDAECRVLRRLGVFAGPFSLEAAEAIVAAPGDLDPIMVFDTASRLIDKSLIIAEDADIKARYRLLETIRAFAVSRAHDAGELLELRDTHARWWRDVLQVFGITGPTDDVVAMVDASHGPSADGVPCRRRPGGPAGRRPHDGSHVHHQPVDGIGAQLFPCSPRHGYAADLHRDPRTDLRDVDDGVGPLILEATDALHFRPRSTRFEPVPDLRGFHHWFLHSYTSPSRMPDPGRLAVPARPVVVEAAPTQPCAPRARLPPASAACCDRPQVGPSIPPGCMAPRGAPRISGSPSALSAAADAHVCGWRDVGVKLGGW